MVVRVLVGDLFSSKCQTWVNTVNCVGVMGKGVALEFRNRFPDMYKDYLARCKGGQVKLGRPYLYKRLIPPSIVNFPTKEHWRGLSQLSAIVEGLYYLERHYHEWGITSLAVPPLGCGQGQLEWAVVGPTLYRHLSQLDIPVQLYAPFGTPAVELSHDYLAYAGREVEPAQYVSRGLMPGLVALVEIVKRIEEEPHHWPVGRIMFQKLAYFATTQGIQTGLAFQRGSFGPFSPDLKARITKLLNNGLIREQQLGRMFEISAGPTFDDARRRYLGEFKKSEAAIDRVVDLFLRMNSTNRAELAATVHHTAKELTKVLDRQPDEQEVLEAVLKWKQRRRPPVERQEVANVIRQMASLGWLDVSASADLTVDDQLDVVEMRP